MKRAPHNRATEAAGWIFRLLTHLLPKALYQDYAREMALVFDDSCRAAAQRNGWPGLLVAGLRGLGDLVGGAVDEWLLQLRQRRSAGLLVVLPPTLLGILAGWVDLRNDEVQAPVFFVLVFSFALGAVKPGRAWLSAILVGVMLPTMEWLARTLHWHTAYAACGSPEGAFLALIPALIGAYAGAAARWILSRVGDAAAVRLTREP